MTLLEFPVAVFHAIFVVFKLQLQIVITGTHTFNTKLFMRHSSSLYMYVHNWHLASMHQSAFVDKLTKAVCDKTFPWDPFRHIILGPFFLRKLTTKLHEGVNDWC